MTTYYAIGKYRVDATDEEKVKALKRTLIDAAIELADLRVSAEDIEDALDEALSAAEDESHYVIAYDAEASS